MSETPTAGQGSSLGPAMAPLVSIARVFTSVANERGEKQFFDMPLTQGWPQFIQNLLIHRGLLVTNAWIPESKIELILVDPDTAGVAPGSIDASKVVPIRPNR